MLAEALNLPHDVVHDFGSVLGSTVFNFITHSRISSARGNSQVRLTSSLSEGALVLASARIFEYFFIGWVLLCVHS